MRFPMPITSLPGANLLPLEHKIGFFVLFWGLEPPFSGISSTKSRFLCAFGVWNPPFSGFSSTKSAFLCFFALRNPHFRAFRAQNRGFCAQEDGKVGSESVTAETLTTLPPHLRRRTSAPAHQHPHTSTSAPAPAHPPSNGPQQWHQAPSSAVWRSSAIWRRVMPSGTVLAPCSAVLAPSSAVQVPCNAGWVP